MVVIEVLIIKSIYRHLTQFLGMDGNISVAYDVPNNWVRIFFFFY